MDPPEAVTNLPQGTNQVGETIRASNGFIGQVVDPWLGLAFGPVGRAFVDFRTSGT